jgi:hypothetical protein
MLRLRQEILITQVPTTAEPNRSKVLYFPAVNKVTISESFDDQTTTAELILPRNLKFEDANIYEGSNPLIRRGDKIKISAGYYPNLNVIFEGYISRVNNNVPMELKAEDKMYILKQTIVQNITKNSLKLPDLIKTLMSYVTTEKIEYEALDATIGSIRINEASIGLVLKKLRDDFGIYSFFKNGKLYCGLAYYPNLRTENTILFEKGIIENDLEYLKKEDVKVKVKGILIKTDNTKEEISVGSEDGDLRTVFQYGGTIADLKRTIQTFLEQANYTGYYGSFTTFLEPKFSHGDYVILNSYKYPERKGTYLVKSVNTTFGVDGGRQEIELERRIQ